MNSIPLNMSGLPSMSNLDLSGLRNSRHTYPGDIDIRITPATGGTIVSILRGGDFGSAPDLHVISDEQDLGAELGKIITLACLKQK